MRLKQPINTATHQAHTSRPIVSNPNKSAPNGIAIARSNQLEHSRRGRVTLIQLPFCSRESIRFS
jgi:hypothetical protein